MSNQPSLLWSPLFWIPMSLFFIADQVSKDLAERGAESIVGVPVLLAHNYEGALGSFAFARPEFLGAAAIVFMLAYLVFQHRYMPGLLALGAALMVGGLLGNAIDRIAHGGVVDWIPGPGDTVMNLADVFGAIGLVVCAISIARRAMLRRRTEQNDFVPQA